MSRRLGLGCLLLGFALTASSARAQDGEADAPAEGRAAFEAGVEAFDAGELEAALTQFERALQLTGREVIRFNIATCFQRLARHRAALLEFERLAAMQDLPEATRAQARERAVEARSQLGALSVDGEPAGARVAVDDEPLCAIPCRVDLDPGGHVVQVEAEGHVARTDEVEIARGELSELAVVLIAEPSIEASPAPIVAAAPPDLEPAPSGEVVGALGWTGLALAVVGGGGIVGFGLRGLDLEAQYDAMPTDALREEGIAMQIAANASIGLAALGAILFVIDLAVE